MRNADVTIHDFFDEFPDSRERDLAREKSGDGDFIGRIQYSR